MSQDDGLTQIELSAYLRRLAALELEESSSIHGKMYKRIRRTSRERKSFLSGRISALLAIAELVERGEIRGGLFEEPIYRLHVPTRLDASMPDD